MNALLSAFRQTMRQWQLVGLIYVVTLVLGLLVALPLYNTIKLEDQNSLAVLKLLDGLDYTVFSDFLHRSQRTINPLISVGRWMGLLYLFLTVFFAGGVLVSFAQPAGRFSAGHFLQGCSQYVGRFLKLFGVTFLFVVAGAGLWLIIGSLVGVLLSDSLTERGQFWIGAGFFTLFAVTATLVLCIGDFAKVLMVREGEQRAFRAFGLAGRLVLRNPGRTLGFYWLFILVGTGLFGVYFLVDSLVTMRDWLTIGLLFGVQQALIFARTALKVAWLGTAYGTYATLPQPSPILRSEPAIDSTAPFTSPGEHPEQIV